MKDCGSWKINKHQDSIIMMPFMKLCQRLSLQTLVGQSSLWYEKATEAFNYEKSLEVLFQE